MKALVLAAERMAPITVLWSGWMCVVFTELERPRITK